MRSTLLSFAIGNQRIPESVASIERPIPAPKAAAANTPAFRFLSAEEVKDVPPAELKDHPAVKECLQEYTDMVNRLKEFVETNANKATPPWKEKTIKSITGDIDKFHQKLQEPKDLTDMLPVMYGRVKESLHYFEELLNDKSYSIQKRLNSLQTLAPHLPYCSGAILDTLQRVISDLKGKGLGASAYLVKRDALTTMAENHVKKHCRKCPPGNQTHAASYLLWEIAEEMGIQKSTDNVIMEHGKPYVTTDDVKRFRAEVRAMFTPKVLARGLAEGYQSHVKGGLPKDINVADGFSQEEEESVKENIKRMEHETLIDDYGVVDPNVLFERDWETYQNRFAKDPTNLTVEFLQKLRREEIVSFDDTVTLSQTVKDGTPVKINMLGNMFWCDNRGNAKELEAADLLELSPASLLENLKKDDSLKEEKYGAIAEEIAQFMSEASYQQPKLQIPAEWVREMHSTFAPYLSFESSQAMRHLAVQSGATELVNQWIEKASKDQLNQQDDFGCSLALLAAKHGRMDTLNLLKKKGADLTLPDIYGRTGVALATMRGHTEVVKTFMGMPNFDFQRTALLAGANGRPEIIKLFDQKEGINFGPVFLVAVQSGHANVVEALKDHKGIKFDLKDTRGNTFAMEAAMRGHAAVIKVLAGIPGLDADFFKLKNQAGETAVMLAASKGHAAVIKALAGIPGLDADFFNLKNPAGETAALIAAKNGKAEVIDELKQIGGVDFTIADAHGYKPVTIAAEKGHANVIASLKGTGVDFNDTHKFHTVAELAVTNGRANVIKELKTIEEVDLTERPTHKKSLVMLAAESGHANIIEELKDVEGIDFNFTNESWHGKAPLHFAAEKGHAKVIEAFKKIPGVDFNIKDWSDGTPFRTAIVHGKVDVVKALQGVEGIDFNTETFEGSALLSMAQRGDIAMLEALKEIPQIDLGKPIKDGHLLVNVATQQGQAGSTGALPDNIRSLVTTAAQHGRADFIRALKDIPGIDFNLPYQGKTAAMIAAANGDVKVIEALKEIPGVDFNKATPFGTTAAMMAAEKGHAAIIEALQDAPGIDFNKQMRGGMTAAIIAVYRGHANVIEALGKIPEVDFTLTDDRGRNAEMYAIGLRRDNITLLLNAIKERRRASISQTIPEKRNISAVSSPESPERKHERVSSPENQE